MISSNRKLTFFTLVVLAGLIAVAIGAGPAWWATSGAVDSNLQENEYSAVNQGQLKHFTAKAVTELNAALSPDGAGPTLNALVQSWTTAHPDEKDYDAVTVGQLKYIGALICDRLGLPYPWSATTSDDSDEAIANIGQLKLVFNFEIVPSTNGIPNWWIDLYFPNGGIPTDPTEFQDWLDSDPTDSGLTIAQKIEHGLDPHKQSTNDIGIPDGWLVQYGINPLTADLNSDDDDGIGDGLALLEEYEYGGDPTKRDTDGDGRIDGEDAGVDDPAIRWKRIPETRYAVIRLATNDEERKLRVGGISESGTVIAHKGGWGPTAEPYQLKVWKNGTWGAVALDSLEIDGSVRVNSESDSISHTSSDLVVMGEPRLTANDEIFINLKYDWQPNISNISVSEREFSIFARWESSLNTVQPIPKYHWILDSDPLGYSFWTLELESDSSTESVDVNGLVHRSGKMVVQVNSYGSVSHVHWKRSQAGGPNDIIDIDDYSYSVEEMAALPSGEILRHSWGSDIPTTGEWFGVYDITRSGYCLGTLGGQVMLWGTGVTQPLAFDQAAYLGEDPLGNPIVQSIYDGDPQYSHSMFLIDGEWIRASTYLPAADFNLSGESISGDWIWRNGKFHSLLELSASSYESLEAVEISDQRLICANAWRWIDEEGNYFSPPLGEPVLLLPIQFLTKGKDDKLKPVGGFFNGTAAPVIDAAVGSCSISEQGVVTVSFSGNITDATSDLIDEPSKQLQTLKVKSPAGETTVNLSNSASPELPWKPYKFESSFSKTVSFSVTAPGEYPIELTTSENAAGMEASTQTYVNVSEVSDNVILTASLDPNAVDVIRFYSGSSSSGGSEELMTETAANSKVFMFGGANPPFFVEVLSGGALTTGTDSLSVRLRFPDNSSENWLLDETAATSNHFKYSRLLASCSVFPATGSGTFLPIAVRFPPNSILEAPDIRIRVMDEDWKLAKMDFGDGEYLYAMDDQDKVTVFNPSKHAQTHIQTKPVPAELAVRILKAGDELGVAQLNRLDGLLVKASVKNFLGDSLIADTYEEEIVRIGNEFYYNYRPKKDNDSNPLPVQRAGNAGNEIKEEILWRYVTAKDKVVIFTSKEDLERDVTYRKYVIEAAKSARFAYIGDGATQVEPKFNPVHWNDRVVPTVYGNVKVELKNFQSPTAAYAAVRDAFVNPGLNFDPNTSTYAMACKPGAQMTTLWALGQMVGSLAFGEIVGVAPLLAEQIYEINTVSEEEEDKTFWIPGDWGYLHNLDYDSNDPNDAGRNGENIIYLGGCYDTTFNNFKQNALFWGHGMNPSVNNIMTLEEMMDRISAWGTIELGRERASLNPDVVPTE